MARRTPDRDQDASRREFFKQFGRQTVQNAGAVAGAAAELRRSSLAVARELFDMNEVATIEAPTTSKLVTPDLEASAPQETFRSPYRFTGTSVVVLDQRELPQRSLTFEADAANDVASALRSGAVTQGPVMGQIAAYGMALAARAAAVRSSESRDQVIGAAKGSLKASRVEVHAVATAVDRMASRYGELANQGAGGDAISDLMAAEADAIAAEATVACAEIGRLWSELVVGDSRDQVDVLLHGESGALACGMVGMSTSGLRSMIDAGRRVHAWITDAAPGGEGSRILAFEMVQLDIPHTVIPDSSVGWLLGSRQLSAVVLRGDTVTANGDVATLMGGRGVATLAQSAGVPVHVLAPEASWDRAAPDASHLVLDLRSAAELGSASRARLNPTVDIVPAALVTAVVSERAH